MKIGKKEDLPMFAQKMLIPLIVVFLLVCAGCGSGGRELTVGTYNDHNELVLDKRKTVTDTESIDKIKSILADQSAGASKAEGKPDYVVMINNKKDSTMEIGAELWQQADGTMIAGRVFGGEEAEAYLVDRSSAEDIKSTLGL